MGNIQSQIRKEPWRYSWLCRVGQTVFSFPFEYGVRAVILDNTTQRCRPKWTTDGLAKSNVIERSFRLHFHEKQMKTFSPLGCPCELINLHVFVSRPIQSGTVQVRVRHVRGIHNLRHVLVPSIGAVPASQAEERKKSNNQDERLSTGISANL